MTSPSPSFLRIGRQQWQDTWAGVRAVAPLMPGAILFGLAFGALIRVAGINAWVGNFASVSVVAGASQIAIVEQLRAGAPAAIAVLTALVINARFALYSAALAPVFEAFPARWRLGLAHLMTDQSAVVALQHSPRWPDPVRRRWFIWGSSGPFVAVWAMGTAAGIALGPVIPDSWQIGFIVPLMFLAVLVPGLRDSPALVAVAVSVGVVLLGKELPYGLNVLLGALAGIAAGAMVPRRAAAHDDANEDPENPPTGSEASL
ncbi:AzlC family ABC transporter permease [Demequina mangrovi]|uniref:Predicted branched-chain amino acid permease (Azaleucine resistance) n=1 Tax=Demequina mangrovi TaxID=1043493 RepID=A0A1H7AEQ9_9MICO|nr:AzlC family ABC transporter permease [Demequina mangrovi]SEJ63426.1 Predicted branched-chain amino acid permease (azaleucine resistance) [Demequina mangrovi]